MSWIKTIPYEEADGALAKVYQRIKGPDNYIDNILTVHSLRPHTLKGHMALYKNVLHHTANTIPKWFLEALGVYVSALNRCDYCVEHHFHGMKRLIDNDYESNSIRAALLDDAPEEHFEGVRLAAFRYARKLTLTPDSLTEKDIDALRALGLDDGQILEINQVVSYFSYANRTVLGLGVNTDGDVLGLSPGSSDSDDWSHV